MSELDLTSFGGEEELKGFTRVKPGQYHVAITLADNSRDEVDALKVTFEVLDGTVPGQASLSFNNLFNDPDPSHKDGGKFCAKLLGRLGLVTGVIPKTALGRRVSVDWALLKHKQLVVFVREGKKKGDNGRGWPEIDVSDEGLGMYAVDSDAVKHVPKNAEALRLGGYIAAATPPQGQGQGDEYRDMGL